MTGELEQHGWHREVETQQNSRGRSSASRTVLSQRFEIVNFLGLWHSPSHIPPFPPGNQKIRKIKYEGYSQIYINNV